MCHRIGGSSSSSSGTGHAARTADNTETDNCHLAGWKEECQLLSALTTLDDDLHTQGSLPTSPPPGPCQEEGWGKGKKTKVLLCCH